MAESGNGGDKTKLILHVSNHEYYANPYENAPPKYKDGYHNWYLVTDDDISSSSSSSSDARVAAGEGRILSPIRRMFVEFPMLTTSVYVDSTIYVLGGWEFPPHNKTKDMFSRDLRYIDAFDASAADDASSGGWIRAPPMLFPRVKPCVVVVDRKMYVFGGNQRSLQHKPAPWAEVFDIQSQKWSELPVPIDITEKRIAWGSALNLDVVVEEGHKMNKFMLLYHNTGALLYYDFVKDICGT